jgi:cell wall-associated NlpC family hydrolase
MSAAKATAAKRGLRRRSAVTFLAAMAAASLTLGSGSFALVLGADPNGTDKPATTLSNPPAKPQDKPVTLGKPDAPGKAPTPDEQRTENVIAAARQYVGIPYRVGSEGPSLFDCSGLVFRAFSDTGLVDRIGSARLRAAGYMRWFASRGLMTRDESQAQRGDLVVYHDGSHIGIYLGDGRVISALVNPFGVTVHSLHGVSLPVSGFLRPDWSGEGKVAPFVPVDLPDVPETPVTLVAGAEWMPTLDPELVAAPEREGTERPDMRTTNSRTFQSADGTFTTEFHAQPIYYQPAGTTRPADLLPIDLTFLADRKTGYASVTKSPVTITTRAADDAAGFVSAVSGDRSVSLSLATHSGMAASKSHPQILDGGRVVDFFGFQPNGAGMRVLAQPDGFKTFLVMSKKPDSNQFSFVLDAAGLTPVMADDGSVMLTDEEGNSIGRIAKPLLLDSSDIDGNGGGVFTAASTLSVDTSGDAPVITVSVRRTFLDEAVYPAYVDLSLTDFPERAVADVAFASSAHPTSNMHDFQRPESPGFDELWLGHQPSSRNDNEVFLRFPGLAAALGNVDVASASLELLPYFQRANDGVTIVRRLTDEWSAQTLTWDTRPATDALDPLEIKSTPADWSRIDVGSYITDVLSRDVPDFGLVLAGEENANGTWKRLAASDAGAAAQFGPRLVVTWSGLRPSATAVTPAPDEAVALPTLTWSQPEIAADQARFEVEVSHDNFATIDVTSGSIKGKAGKATSWTIPSGSLTYGSAYSWRVRVKYGEDKAWSTWSTPQVFALSFRDNDTVNLHNAPV